MISRYFVYFIFYSFMGWVWETMFCSFKTKHFQNRGFLFGPICPIYGAALIILQGIDALGLLGFSENTSVFYIFLICAAGSAVIEFSTSFYLEKRFHARWWDYSALPMNLQGRIALPVTVAFGVAGTIVYLYLLPQVRFLDTVFPDVMAQLLALLLAMGFGADFALTEANLSTLLQKMRQMEEEFTEKGEQMVLSVTEVPAYLKAKAEEKEVIVRARAKELSAMQKHILRKMIGFRPFHSENKGSSIGVHLKSGLSENEAGKSAVK